MNKKIAIITAEFNKEITFQLERSCAAELQIHNAELSQLYCPGAVELTQVANRISKKNNYDAIILIGAIIKGDTDHYEYVCNLVTQLFANFVITVNIPIVFGVLTTHNEELAEERANPLKMKQRQRICRVCN